MKFNFQEVYETIRISRGKIKIRVMVSSGKQGDFHIIISPTLLVSGYGTSEDEAVESFKHNMMVFCEDILSLNKERMDLYLKKLGFQREKYASKNYRNSYDDKNEVLSSFEPATTRTKMLEAAF